MKTKIIPIICFLLLGCFCITGSLVSAGKSNSPLQETIYVYTTPDFYNLTMKWVDEYRSANPLQDIQVRNITDPEMSAQFQTGENICFTSSGQFPDEKQEAMFQVVVGREIIVPLISPKNPFLDKIDQQGISREALAGSLQSPGKKSWGSLLNNDMTHPVTYYILNEETVQSGVAGFIGSNNREMGSMISLDRDALIAALQKDPYAIGFCRLADILQPSNLSFPESVRLMPIDKNGSGKMEYMEQIYGNAQEFSRGVWIGKYPKALIRNLYCVANSRPQEEANLAFLNWVLTSGQAYLPVTGYSDMTSNEQQTQLNKLVPPPMITPSTAEAYSAGSIVLIVVFGLVVVGFIIALFSRRIRKGHLVSLRSTTDSSGKFDEQSVIVPGGLYFDKTHTWAFMEQTGMVKIGIDDFLQHVVGPVTRIEMKNPGDMIQKGDLLCTLIQKGKQLAIYAPVSGRINGQNEMLLTDLSAFNHSPYTYGWIYTLEPSNWVREIGFLAMADKYQIWLREEFARLKDFLASLALKNTPFPAQVVLQEGGQLSDHILSKMEPEVWEDFQINFLRHGR